MYLSVSRNSVQNYNCIYNRILKHKLVMLLHTTGALHIKTDGWRFFNIQSNLGDSNADFSKPPDFSNLTASPDLFSYHLM